MAGTTAVKRVWRASVVALIFATFFHLFSTTPADPDLWGHVSFGQLILDSGAIPEEDPYSYLTKDQRWINHEWLSEVTFASLYDHYGVAGLVALKTAIALFVLAILFSFLRRQGLVVVRAGIVLLVAAAPVLVGLHPIRPQAFTMLLFPLTLLVLHAAEEGRSGWLWGLVPIFALWPNFHGGILAGAGVLGLWSMAHVVRTLRRERHPHLFSPPARLLAVLAVVASGLATLCTPYGWGLLFFLLETATVSRPEITEWQPLEIRSVWGAVYLVVLTLTATALLWSDRPKRPAVLFVLAVTALMPLLSVRHLPLFGFAAVVLGGPDVANAWERWSPTITGEDVESRLGRWLPWTAVLNLGVACGIVVIASTTHFSCLSFHENRYPVRAAALLEKAGISGNLAIDFNWGEYAIWHLAPKIRVSMDGRRETVYRDEIYQEHAWFLHGVKDWDAVLDDRRTDLALVSKTRPTFNLLKLKPGWALVYDERGTALFARTGSGMAEALRGADPGAVETDSGWLCFP